MRDGGPLNGVLCPPLLPLNAVENGHIKRLTDEDIQSSVLEVAGANVATAFITCPADPAKSLGIKLPFLVMIIKNLNKYFTFEVQVLDDKNVRRRFRASNYQVVCGWQHKMAVQRSLTEQPALHCAMLNACNKLNLRSVHLVLHSMPAKPSLSLSPVHTHTHPHRSQSTTRVKPFICTMPMRLDEGWNQVQFNLADFVKRAYGTNYVETLRVQIHANCRIRRIYFSDRLYSEAELPSEFKVGRWVAA
jgi:hypothetical protein